MFSFVFQICTVSRKIDTEKWIELTEFHDGYNNVILGKKKEAGKGAVTGRGSNGGTRVLRSYFKNLSFNC